MIYIESTTDFEFYSGTSKGAIQGYGYEFAIGKFPVITEIDRLLIPLQMALTGEFVEDRKRSRLMDR
jgi:hypothetical protein